MQSSSQSDYLSLTVWQRLRTKIFLFSVGLYRRMTVGARAVILDGEQVFLIKHTYLPGWHFPGGGVEPGETVLDALVREVDEEVGLRITGQPDLHGAFLNVPASRRDQVLIYVVRSFETLRPFEANFEIAEGRWFSRHDLPEDVNAGTRQRLVEIFEGEPQTGYW